MSSSRETSRKAIKWPVPRRSTDTNGNSKILDKNIEYICHRQPGQDIHANEGQFKNIVYIVTYFDGLIQNDESSWGNIGVIMRIKSEETTPHFKTATLHLHD